ncbi:hypothetical protein VAEU17_4400143 [Vibrio aestuarianus]|nr:hypothetical protein VAEU17_4400143 [Vibrio aestuarianus]
MLRIGFGESKANKRFKSDSASLAFWFVAGFMITVCGRMLHTLIGLVHLHAIVLVT